MNETNSPFFHCGEDQTAHRNDFSHVSEPAFTAWYNKCSVNTVCLRKFPDCTHIQILVHKSEKKLIVRPCEEDEKDSLRWRRSSNHTPRQISCPLFCAKLFLLMEWRPDFRYRIIGKSLQAGCKPLLLFDLTTPEIFPRNGPDAAPGFSQTVMQVLAADDRIIFGIRNVKGNKKEDLHDERIRT